MNQSILLRPGHMHSIRPHFSICSALWPPMTAFLQKISPVQFCVSLKPTVLTKGIEQNIVKKKCKLNKTDLFRLAD